MPARSEAPALSGEARPATAKPAVALKKLRLFNIGTIPASGKARCRNHASGSLTAV
jgi:hypothetical protein